ncbi:MAG: hypothetical protein LUD68_02170, partial [Rikenellaceae bacterium]|nr:hypothetical protein [Rikenellaceae bacterium]
VELFLDEDPTQLRLPALPGPLQSMAGNPGYIAKAEQKWIMENGMRTIYMDAVQVTGRKSLDAHREMKMKFADYVYDQEYFKENKITDLQTLFFMIPGLQVNPDGLHYSRGEVKFEIDNFPAWDWFDWRMDVQLQDIEHILFTRPPEGGLIIQIYLVENPGVNKIRFNRKIITPLGYQVPAEFYSPVYATAGPRDRQTPDLRTTLYWNPALQTDR